MGLEAAELARWTRFAAKGGIGKCVALCDCVAESADDLMFLKDDDITVLFQIPDTDGLYLGHCEGVVGRFNGADVRFLTRLKKPVMTKRSSVSATSNKSPSPALGKAPSPAPAVSRPTSLSRKDGQSLDPRGSSHVVSPLVSHLPLSDEVVKRPPHLSYSSTSTGSESQMSSPAHPVFSPLVVHKTESSVQSVSSPRDIGFSSQLSRSAPSTRPPSPPNVSVKQTNANGAPAQVSAKPSAPPQHRYVALAPSPLNLIPDSTSPLRITKRSPTSPPASGSSPYQTLSLSPPAPLSPSSSSSAQDVTYSTYQDQSQRLSSGMSDAQGIGLSLLQDLMNGGDSDDSDEDDRWSRSSKYSGDGAENEDEVALRRVGHGPRDSLTGSQSQEGTVEGLGYAMPEDSHTHKESNHTQYGQLQPSSPPTSNPQPPIDKPPPVSNAHLSPTTSPTSPLFPHRSPNIDARRPSLASSATSAASTGSWEGASDIYDDYRYSRFSTASKMSRFSTVTGPGMSPTPPVPEGRPSIDSTNQRSRVDSGASGSRLKLDAHVLSPPSLSQVLESSGVEGEDGKTRFEPKKTSLMGLKKERTMSVDSDASVYTQNSRLSTASITQEATLAMLREPVDEDRAKLNVHPRPAPLKLVQENSPLLNTTWGSPLSSPDYTGSLKSSSTFYTPVPGNVPVGRGLGVTSPSLGGFASAMRQRLEEERLSPNPDVEVERRAGEHKEIEVDADRHEQTKVGNEGEGLGHRIVIEDEDELPSRIVNSTFHESPSSSASASPEPELLLGKHLAPLVVTNRTPSPSINEGASDEAGGLASRLRMLDEGEDQNSSKAPSRRETPPPASTSSPSSGPLLRISEPGSSPIIPSDPPLPPSTPPKTSVELSNSPSPSHLRPSLRELREGGMVIVPGTNQRRSLFLPHPNAPKAPPVGPDGVAASGGPYIASQPEQKQTEQTGQSLPGLHPPQGPSNYVQSQQQQPTHQQPPPSNIVWNPNGSHPPPPLQQQPHPVRPNVLGVIRMALSLPPRGAVPPGPPGPPRPTMPPRGPTIYGRTEVDLAASVGPVPIVWSVEPPPITKKAMAPPNPSASAVNAPQITAAGKTMSPPRVQMMAKPQATRSKSLGPGVVAGSDNGGVGSGSGSGTGSGSGSGVGVGIGRGASVGSNAAAAVRATSPENKVASGGTGAGAGASGKQPRLVTSNEQLAAGGAIPRANFFPKGSGSRPRSRSFSGFNLTTAESIIPVQRSREDSELPPASDVKRSLTTSISAPSPSLTSASSLSSSSSTPPSSKPSSSPLRPSPLSLSSASLKPTSVSPALKSPSSPLSKSITAPRPESPPTNPSPSPSFMSLNLRPLHQLRQVPSRSTLNESLTRPGPVTRTTLPAASPAQISTSPSPPFAAAAPGRTTSLQVIPRRDVASLSSRVDPDAASVHSARSQLVSPPPMTRQTSLRSKLSLPNLRRKQSRQDDESTMASSPPNTIESELLQVQDMEFELVRPSLSHFSAAARTSEDSGVLARETSLDSKPDGFLRAESPAISTLSSRLSEQRSINAEGGGGWVPSAAASPPGSKSNTDVESSMDAHRQRELKWMSHMSSNPASQARKSKKVKKLVVDGVPSSVRYLVWSYLTDGKARCVPGVYGQLSGRGKVSVSVDIDRDIKMSFQDQPHLQGTQGPVLLLLQAYLNMVPDVVYSRGLTLIVGQLLLLSPEEDAFWIFVSIMDTHIRSYFSSTTTQMEVDSALFSRALEVNDNVVAKKLFVDLGINPALICQPWFSSLFVGTLPPEYVNRVWDLFLFEGVPFLIRVALSLITCCRRKLLESTSEESVLQILSHPPQAWLPASPDGLLSLAFGVKLKDDDVRKQRIKMEAQIKRQTQLPRVSSSMTTSSMISLPRV